MLNKYNVNRCHSIDVIDITVLTTIPYSNIEQCLSGFVDYHDWKEYNYDRTRYP